MRVSVIYTGRMNALNGASKVVDNFRTNASLFKERGIDYGGVFALPNVPTRPSYAGKNIKTIKDKISEILYKSYIGNCVGVYLSWFRRAKQVVDNYYTSRRKDDVVIFHDIFAASRYLHITSEKERAKMVVVLHNGGDDLGMFHLVFSKIEGRGFDKKIQQIFNEVYHYADRLAFVSEIARENFCRLHPEFESKTKTVYNGIPDIKFEKHGNDKNLSLISVGTVCFRKNQIAILRSLAAIKDKSIHYTVVGGGPEFSTCKKFVEMHKLNSQVDLLGPQDNVHTLLAKNNVFIMSSLDEGLPIAAIEALRAGLPLIITDVGGNQEVVNKNGLLIKTDDYSISNAICWMSEHLDKLDAMGQASRKLYEEKFTVYSMINTYCDLCYQTLNFPNSI